MADTYVDRVLMDVMEQTQRLPKDTRAGLAAEWHAQVRELLAGEGIAPPLPPVVTLTLTVGGRVAVSQDIPLHPAPVGSGNERR